MVYENECVDIILINYNNYTITEECVLSLIENDYQKINIIIIDNNSSNDAVSKLDEFFSKLNNNNFSYKFVKYTSKTKEYDINKFETLINNIVLISSDENNGYSAGNNIGIFLSKRYFKSKYIWILNNDTTIKKDALKLLVDYSNKNENAFIGATIAYFDKKDIIQTACR